MPKKVKSPERDFMEVTWLDASSEDGWIDENTNLEPPEMITRGWLYKNEEKYLVLVNSIVQDGEGSVGGSNTIPKGMIVSSRKLKVSNASIKLRRKLHPEPRSEELHREPSKG